MVNLLFILCTNSIPLIKSFTKTVVLYYFTVVHKYIENLFVLQDLKLN